MKTTGINKTVYRSNVISALDSFTSVRNVFAWEMFQDGQVRNYDGVIGDLKRLYPEIDFDSVTENVDPESIAADEDAIYTLVDNIINKLIESGISKDNFNYAIWACDDPENVADTYGVDIDDVSAYKITDGIMLQDLGYEGQLYGVAEYPEEEWDVIESALNGVNDVLGTPSKIPPISKGNKTTETENINKTDNYDTLNVQDINDFNAMADIATKILYDTIMQSPNLSISVNQLKFIYTSFLIKYLDDETITQSDLEEKLKEYNSTLSPEIVSAIVSAFFLKRKKRTEDGEEYYEISNSFQGGNMKTREDYKDYYLEQLIENYGDMTEADYNSAQKFCYDEEWNLGEVGNMAEAIDGLGDAWTEYQKQYKEGFKIMNSKNITSALDYDKIYYNIIETANPYDRTDQWEFEKYQRENNALRKRYPKDEFVKYIDYAAEQMSGDVEQIAKYLKQIGVPNTHGQNGYIAMYTFNNLIGREYSTRFEDWMNAVRWKDISIEEMAQEIYNAIHNIKSSKQSIKSSKENNMIKSSKETLYEDDGGRFYTWPELKADIDDFVKTSDFKDQFEGDEDMFEYFEKDHKTPKYYKIYMDFWDISSNGAMSEVEGTEEQWDEYNEQHGITSAKENNMKTPIKSGYTGTNVSVEYGPYGEEKEFPFYDMKGETVEQIDERIGYYDEVKTAWGSDGESYMILQDRTDSEDKIAVLEDDYNEWVESMNSEDYSKLLGNSRKAIKSANGSWEYQLDDMDEVEEKIGDIGISFTEPLLLADDGTLYTRAGFDQWLKYLEREEGDNWSDAYELYHRETDEEFIEMCQDDFFQHDFGHTLTIYPEGLKSIAESVAEEIPSNEAPFAIPSGFAFNLYAEEEEPSGFNSYWVDDMSLNSESFIWGINPKFGNRFDVAIDPDYLWNGTENIQSSKKREKKMKIQSKRLIKSGTSNFGSNDNVYGYDFPLVTYVAENYVYDEENDVDTEERDYDLDSLEYRDEIDNATDLAAEMDIPLYDDYRDPDYAPPFCIKFRDGYYEGIWIEIKEGGDTEDLSDAEFDNLAAKINTYLDTLVKDYGWQKLGVTARFSNGETMYHKIDNSHKSVISGLTFRQAVQDFKAAGQWNDYYEMQQDWEAYKDGLERDGVISEKTRSTWGNPCTPETFKRLNK